MNAVSRTIYVFYRLDRELIDRGVIILNHNRCMHACIQEPFTNGRRASPMRSIIRTKYTETIEWPIDNRPPT